MRVRIRFTKVGKVGFTSHRDVARIWERALRRAGVPVASTEGFSPRPKVHFGLALPTGYVSEAEYLDVDLIGDGDGDGGGDVDGDAGAAGRPSTRWSAEAVRHDRDNGDVLARRLSVSLPPGIDVTAMAVVGARATSLQQAVTSCSWRVPLAGVSDDELRVATERLLASPTLVVERERKGHKVVDDLRPAILALEVVASGDGDGPGSTAALMAELATQPRSVRPAELVAALDERAREGRVCRLAQWIDVDGARQEPLPAATRPWHAEVRAS